MRTSVVGAAWVVIAMVAGASGVACGGAEQGVHVAPDAGEGTDAPVTGDSGSPVGSDAGADGACRSTADCPTSTTSVGVATCVGPYDWAGCMPGCRMQTVCAADSDCDGDGGTVCRQSSQPIGCGQTQGSAYCSPPCHGDGDCPPTQTCTTGHCQPRSCAQCPSFFSCTGGMCAPKACTTDTECTGGYCVNGSCVGTPGTCMQVAGCG
jgi:hypothetical protein